MGEDVAVRVEGGRGVGEVELFSGATFRVADGDTLLVTAADPRAARAFVLMTAGRIDPSAGLLRVAGHLLPGRGAWVRAHVGVALLAGAADPLRELRRALRGGTTLVAIDGLDTLAGAERDQAAALLRDAAIAVAQRQGDDGARLTVVASARHDGPALGLLADAHRPDVASLALTPLIPSTQVIS